MKKMFFLIATLSITGVSNLRAFTGISDTSRRQVSQKRDLKGFDKIVSDAAADLNISQGPSESVSITAANPDIFNYVHTEVINGELIVKLLKSDKYNWENQGNFTGGLTGERPNHITIDITVKKLNMIRLSGSAIAYSSGKLSGENLKVETVGSSGIKGQLLFTKVTGKISGSSHVSLSGQAGTVDIEMSGSSAFSGEQLSATAIKLSLAENSVATVQGSEKIRGQAAGNSRLFYSGEFPKQFSILGNATVKQLTVTEPRR
jgi:hypothetical protein